MGVCISKETNYRILMTGLDSAGKTTLLYRHKLKRTVSTVPTIGFNAETLPRGRAKLLVFDLGGQDKLRPLWRHYVKVTDGLLYVVDSSDDERLDDASLELHRILATKDMAGVPVVVLANKQDLKGAMTPTEVGERLGLADLRGRKWHIQGTCAVTGEGLDIALDAMIKLLPRR